MVRSTGEGPGRSPAPYRAAGGVLVLGSAGQTAFLGLESYSHNDTNLHLPLVLLEDAGVLGPAMSSTACPRFPAWHSPWQSLDTLTLR